MSVKSLLYFALSLFFSSHVHAQDLSQKATNFLKTLSPELKSKTLFSRTDEERYNMNYVPIDRKGPTFNDFNEKQKSAALELLKASLSTEGYRKTSEIMELENVLKAIENNPRRDYKNYHFCIFGEPSEKGFWGWKFEGHHISLNFASTNNQVVSSTPSFFCSNPAIVTTKGFDSKEVLKLETELGFSLVNSLTETQLKVARLSDSAPAEIITGNKRKVQSIEPKGISYNKLTEGQKETFMKLLNVYVDNYQFGFAKTFRVKIEKSGYDNLSFAWAGSLKPGKGHYYRIQGPMLLIEYDNIQNNANHVHTVVRDLTNDFAEDILREHYQKDH